MKIKQIEISTIKIVFDDSEPKYVKRTVSAPKPEPKQVEAIPKPKEAKPKQTRSKHMWTDDEKREALQMYNSGEEIDTIAKKFSSTPMSVQKIAQQAGVKRPWPTRGNPSKLKQEEPQKEEPV